MFTSHFFPSYNGLFSICVSVYVVAQKNTFQMPNFFAPHHFRTIFISQSEEAWRRNWRWKYFFMFTLLYCRRRLLKRKKEGKNKFVLRIAFSYTNTHPIISHFHSVTPARACVRYSFFFSYVSLFLSLEKCNFSQLVQRKSFFEREK